MSVVAAALLFTSLAASDPVLVDRIVASVDERIVSRSMIDARVKLGAPSRAEARDALIEELLVENECDRLRITVEREEIDRALLEVAAGNKLTRQELIAAVEAHGMDLATYQRELRRQLLEMRWVMSQGDRAAKPETSGERLAWLEANRRQLLDAARGRAAIDVREGEP